MAENISSSVLFHFTHSMDALKGILMKGFFPRYCLEYTLEPDDRKAASHKLPPKHAVPMVCFCDLPMSLIRKHHEAYGPYAIGLTKAWGLKHGVSPVIYTHSRAQTREPISRLSAKALKTSDSRLSDDLKIVAAYTKRFQGPAWRVRERPRFQSGVKFYDEREWRYVPPVHGAELFLSWDDYKNDSKRAALHKGLEKHVLKVEPDFIMYLILPYDESENNVIKLHDFLFKLYPDRRDAILVATTIMTDDCLEDL